MRPARYTLLAPLLLLTASLGCKSKTPPLENAAPAASVPLEAPKPASTAAAPLVVETGSSKVEFVMDSALEKIHGEAPGSVSGELSVDLEDLSRSSGLIKVDLQKLALFRQDRNEQTGQYGERSQNPLQNENARYWLQIVPQDGEVSAEDAAQNRFAEFRVDKLQSETKSVRALSGAERKLTATLSGLLRLHGRQLPRSAKVELTFRYAGDQLESLGVKSLEPLDVNLEKFAVHPRDGAGKFMKTVTDAVATTLKGKIKGDAPVTFELSAKPK